MAEVHLVIGLIIGPVSELKGQIRPKTLWEGPVRISYVSLIYIQVLNFFVCSNLD